MQSFLILLALAGLIDSVSWMVVTPSLVFYVREELGGSKEAYGLALSAFSFCSFLTKPILGRLSDQAGFRVPLMISFTVASLGGLLYFLASGLTSSSAAVGVLLLSRCMGGVGGGNSALGYAYLARALPLEEQTSGNTILSLMRILGMSVGPFLNDLLVGLQIPLTKTLLVDPLNSVGLAVMILNASIGLLIYFYLVELPPAKATSEEIGPSPKERQRLRQSGSLGEILRAFTSLEILTPFLCTFVYNANFQLIETSFAPVAKHALDWGTVETSQVLGSVSLIITGMMMIVYILSKKFMLADELLMAFGLSFSVISYFFLYFSWTDDALPWHFWFPVLLAAGAFPFLASPTVSVFSKQVSLQPALARHQGTMQALLGMSASVAGFATPSFVATMVLRHPREVDQSLDHREITPWALYAPVLSLITLCMLIYVETRDGIIWCQSWAKLEEELEEEEEEFQKNVHRSDETTPLAFRRNDHRSPYTTQSPYGTGNFPSPGTALKWRRSFVGDNGMLPPKSPQLTPKFQYRLSGHHLMADISRTTGVYRVSSQILNGWEQQEVAMAASGSLGRPRHILLQRSQSTGSV